MNLTGAVETAVLASRRAAEGALPAGGRCEGREGAARGEGCGRSWDSAISSSSPPDSSPGELQEWSLLPPLSPPPPEGRTNWGELELWGQSRGDSLKLALVFPCYNCTLGVVKGRQG